jgi:hypothetical protein
MEKGRTPDFDDVWEAASSRAALVRKRQRALAGSAAVAAVVAIAFAWLAPHEDEWRYIDAGGFLETTSWSAPSDTLLPEHQIDIYRDIPVLIESTGTNGGALL